VITYRATLDVPLQLVLKVSNLLKRHRAELGTRNGTRALTCWQQAKFVLAWFRDKPDLRRLGQGFGISQSTAYRYKDEGVEVLAREAPSLEEALEKAAEQGLPYVILDGTLISADRCSDKKTSRKGTEIDKWHSGKAHEHAGLVQGITSPDGIPLWASEVLPGLRPRLKAFPCLADSGYEGAGAGVLVPVRKPARGDLDTDTKCRSMLLRGLRYQGERGFALLKERWRALQHVTVSPTQIGDIVKAALVLTQIEHKMIA
jgi:DDE superfamily endonuclease